MDSTANQPATVQDIRKIIQELNDEKRTASPGLIERLKNNVLPADAPEKPQKTEAEIRKERISAMIREQGKAKRGFMSKWFPTQVRIVWFDHNCGHINIRWMDWNDNGLVTDRMWGEGADVANVSPVEITVDGKTSIGFVVDGDKGVGCTVERCVFLQKLKLTAKLAWSIIGTQKVANAVTTDTTLRAKIGFFLFGGVVFLLFLGRYV